MIGVLRSISIQVVVSVILLLRLRDDMVKESVQSRCERIASHFLGWREKAKIRRICTTRFLEFGANYLTSKDRLILTITTVPEERT